MSEIKFRAWDTKHNKMLDNEYLKKITSAIIEAANEILEIDCSRRLKPTGLYLANEDIGMIFMQCTGAKDKNGAEAYEGDEAFLYFGLSNTEGLCRKNPYKFKITYDKYKGRYEFEDEKGNCYGMYEPMGFEIVGNIYEQSDVESL